MTRFGCLNFLCLGLSNFITWQGPNYELKIKYSNKNTNCSKKKQNMKLSITNQRYFLFGRAHFSRLLYNCKIKIFHFCRRLRPSPRFHAQNSSHIPYSRCMQEIKILDFYGFMIHSNPIHISLFTSVHHSNTTPPPLLLLPIHITASSTRNHSYFAFYVY